MIKREQLKVGARFLNTSGVEVEISYIGTSVVIYFHLGYSRELNTNIDYILKHWTLLPQEPKKIGKLYMCVKDIANNTHGDLYVITHGMEVNNHWQAVTIDENGNVFEVIDEGI